MISPVARSYADVFVKKGGFPPSKVKDLTTITDKNGDFTLGRLPPRTLSLWISHVDHTESLFEGIDTPPCGHCDVCQPKLRRRRRRRKVGGNGRDASK